MVKSGALRWYPVILISLLFLSIRTPRKTGVGSYGCLLFASCGLQFNHPSDDCAGSRTHLSPCPCLIPAMNHKQTSENLSLHLTCRIHVFSWPSLAPSLLIIVIISLSPNQPSFRAPFSQNFNYKPREIYMYVHIFERAVPHLHSSKWECLFPFS